MVHGRAPISPPSLPITSLCGSPNKQLFRALSIGRRSNSRRRRLSKLQARLQQAAVVPDIPRCWGCSTCDSGCAQHVAAASPFFAWLELRSMYHNLMVSIDSPIAERAPRSVRGSAATSSGAPDTGHQAQHPGYLQQGAVGPVNKGAWFEGFAWCHGCSLGSPCRPHGQAAYRMGNLALETGTAKPFANEGRLPLGALHVCPAPNCASTCVAARTVGLWGGWRGWLEH